MSDEVADRAAQLARERELLIKALDARVTLIEDARPLRAELTFQREGMPWEQQLAELDVESVERALVQNYARQEALEIELETSDNPKLENEAAKPGVGERAWTPPSLADETLVEPSGANAQRLRTMAEAVRVREPHTTPAEAAALEHRARAEVKLQAMEARHQATDQTQTREQKLENGLNSYASLYEAHVAYDAKRLSAAGKEVQQLKAKPPAPAPSPAPAPDPAPPVAPAPTVKIRL